ncbi:MAG: hypothetical protein V3V49_06900 [Candidatus Krumholzibacteria bacterium]
MKKALLLTIVFTLWATMAFAQAGLISIFADVGGNDCNLVDVAGVNNWNFVHMATVGATAIWFKAEFPACYAGSFIADQVPFAVSNGNSQIGLAVGYGQCLVSPILVATVVSIGLGNTLPCCAYPIVGDPFSLSGTIEVTDCAFKDIPNVPSQNGMINSDATCLCAVAVHETTWGQIKAIYRSAD